MAYELKPGQGTAFKNKNQTEDWHPPYKGEVMLPDGSLHWIDIKPGKTKAGEWWFAIKIGGQKMGSPAAPTMRPIDHVRPNEHYSAPINAHSQAKGNAFVTDNDDDIPF
jgi:hypothetical protein